jgi:hypothetical protein
MNLIHRSSPVEGSHLKDNQAAHSVDVSILQLRFVKKLLHVHGTWGYQLWRLILCDGLIGIVITLLVLIKCFLYKNIADRVPRTHFLPWVTIIAL